MVPCKASRGGGEKSGENQSARTDDGIGAYRTHIGSAHGRGIEPPKIVVSEARLAVHASHTIVIFVMERWLGTMRSV